MKYKIIEKSTYDKEITVKGKKVRCYSSKKLKEVYSSSKYEIIGEAKEEKKKDDNTLDTINIGNSTLTVYNFGHNNKLFYKKAGYVCVEENKYICILQSRLTFLILLLALLVAALIAFDMIVVDKPVEDPKPETTQVDRLNRLPDLDENIIELNGENKVESQTNPGLGGHVAIKYNSDAVLDLSTKEISINYENPADSSHDAILELYVLTKNGDKLIVGSSGRIPAGYKIETIKASGKYLSILEKGRFDAVYVIKYYNSKTGEKANVDSEISDIVLTVK